VSRGLRGRVGVVTGAGLGTGREVALGLAGEGMHLALLAHPGAEVRAVAERIGALHDLPVLPFAVDVRDPAAVDRVVAHVEQQLGPVDLLVNDAVVPESSPGPFWEVPVQDASGVVEADLRGPFLLCRALLPAMVQRRHGHVVNLAAPARPGGQAAAGAVRGVRRRALSAFTESLAVALDGTGVVVVDVRPGPVRTATTDPARVGSDDRWPQVSSTASVVADVAAGRYDDRCGSVLDAAALTTG
jgi:NAD(P)-dependent dehydrogenase (short-subunit alcohol dehydrogenase family)